MTTDDPWASIPASNWKRLRLPGAPPGNGGLTLDDLRRVMRLRRRKLRLKQHAVARAMGVTQATVSDLERGQTVNPGIPLIIRWAEALGLEMCIDLREPEEQ